MVGRDAGEFGLRGTRANAAEELLHLPRPLLQVGAQDRRLLVVGQLLHAHLLGLPADGEPCGAADADITHPLRLTARGDQVALALEGERIDRGAVPFAALAPLHREHPRPLHAQPEPAGEEADERVEDSGGEETGLDVGGHLQPSRCRMRTTTTAVTAIVATVPKKSRLNCPWNRVNPCRLRA